jgi:hypothetical protein
MVYIFMYMCCFLKLYGNVIRQDCRLYLGSNQVFVGQSRSQRRTTDSTDWIMPIMVRPAVWGQFNRARCRRSVTEFTADEVLDGT